MKLLEYFYWICFAIVLALAVWQDIRIRKIKNELNVTGVVLGLLFAILLPERNILSALIGVIVLLVVGIFCWKLNFFRAGDAKLLCVVGAFLEWKMGLNVLLIAIICGAIIGLPFVIVRIVKKKKELTKFPFAIAIAIAAIIGLRFGYLWDILIF